MPGEKGKIRVIETWWTHGGGLGVYYIHMTYKILCNSLISIYLYVNIYIYTNISCTFMYIISDTDPSSFIMRRRKKDFHLSGVQPFRPSCPAPVSSSFHSRPASVRPWSWVLASRKQIKTAMSAESKWSYLCMHACTHSRRLLSVFNSWFRTNLLTLIPIVIYEYVHCQKAGCCQPFQGLWPSRPEYPTAHAQLGRNVAGWCGNLLSLEFNSSILWHQVHAVWRDVQISISR